MRNKISFILKIIPLMLLFSFLTSKIVDFSISLYNMIESQANDEKTELQWGVTNYGYIILEETSIELTYGNENPISNIYTNSQNCYAVEIIDSSTDDFSFTSSFPGLEFEIGSGINYAGEEVKLIYIYNIDKIPANCGIEGQEDAPASVFISCAAGNGYAMGGTRFELYVYPKEITEINWTNTDDLEYTGYNQFPEGEPVGLINDDECELIFGTAGGKNAGDRETNLAGLTNTNYYLSESLLSENIYFYINPAPLEITPKLSVRYGEDIDYSNLTYELNQLLGNDKFYDFYMRYNEVDYEAFDDIYDADGNLIKYEIICYIYDFDNNNYEPIVNTGYLEILPAEIEVEYSVSEISISYGEDVNIDDITYEYIGGLLNDDSFEDLPFELKSDYTILDPIYNENGDLIEYSISLVPTAPCNYLVSSEPIRVKVNPIPLTITLPDIELTYADDLDLSSVEYEVEGLLDTDVLENLNIVTNYTSSSSVYDENNNKIEYYLSINDDLVMNNYNITIIPGYINVSPKEINVVWSNTNVDYNGEYQLPKYEITNAVGQDVVNLKLSDIYGRKEVGEYTLYIYGVDNPNYIYNGEESIEFTINSIDVEDFELSSDTKEYDGKSYEIISDVPAGVIPTYTIIKDGLDVSEIKEVGEYFVTANYTTSENYKPIDPKTATITITPKKLTIELDDSGLSFDNTTKYVTINLIGVIEGDIVNAEVEGETSGILAKEYALTITGLDNPNYCLESELILYWNIAKLDVSAFELTNDFKEYDAEAYEISYSFPEGITNYTSTITKAGIVVDEIKDAGEYKITVEFEVDSNYNDVSSKTSTITITPKGITIDWSNLEVDYTGRFQLPTATAQGVIEGETCGIRLAETGRKDAGEYTVFALGTDNSNYVITGETSAQFIINPIDVVEFTFDDITREYNGRVYEITSSVPAGVVGVTYTYLKNGVEVLEIKDAGLYKVTAYYETNDNYKPVEPKTANVTITPKGITIILDYSNLKYDGSEQKVDVELDGVLDGDSLDEAITGNTGTNAGQYNNLSVIIGNPNYIIINSEIPSWSIDKAPVSYEKFNNYSQVYNGMPFVLPNTLPEGVSEIKFTINVNGQQVSEIKNAGTYNVIAEYITDANYQEIESQEFVVVIEPKDITVRFEFVDSEYTGDEKEVAVSFQGTISGENLNETITDSKATEVGSYTTTVTINNSNYNVINDTTYDWQIKKAKAQALNLEDVTKTYDGNTYQLPTVYPTGITNVEYIVTSNNELVTEIKNAGVYNVIVKYTVDTNYNELLDEQITITINKKKLSVVIGDDSKTYNGDEQELVVNILGIVDEDSLDITIDGNKATDVGTYTASISLEDNPNYELESPVVEYTWKIEEISNEVIEDINNSNTNYTTEIIIAISSVTILVCCYFIFKIKKEKI